MRLVRYLARCGVASRRKAGDLVKAGAVRVNGAPTDNPALDVSAEDRVEVDGQVVAPPPEPITVLLHKPAGTVCSRSDPHNPDTVLDLLPGDLAARLKPVGRLDKPTTGLLLLSDEGELAFRLTHPRYRIDKTYRAAVRGRLTPGEAERLRKGVELDDGPTAPAELRIVEQDAARTVLDLTIHEGRKRQVRRMLEALGHPVETLHRTRLGPLGLGKLPVGQWRRLSAEEQAALHSAVGLDV